MATGLNSAPSLASRAIIGPVTVTVTLAFAFLIVVGEQVGMPQAFALHLTGILVAIAIALTAFQARTLSVADWVLARRDAGALVNGMALGASLVSGWMLTAIGGLFFADAGAGIVWLMAPLLGLALSAFLIVPQLRASGAVTPAEFVLLRFGGRLASIPFALAGIAAGLLLLWSNVAFAAAMVQAMWGLDRPTSVVAIAILCGIAVVPGGLRGMIRVNALIFAFLATAYLAPLIWPSLTLTGFPVPQFSYGYGALGDVGAVEEQLRALAIPFFQTRIDGVLPAGGGVGTAFVMTLMLAAGIAAMPFAFAHFAAARSPARTRITAGWAMVMVALVLTAAPALAAFAKLGLYNNLLGLTVGDIQGGAEWLLDWSGKASVSGTGPMATLCGQVVFDTAAAIAACGGDPAYVISPPDIRLAAETVTLAFAQIVGLPTVLGAMIGVAVLAAALAGANAVAVALGAAISRDLLGQDERRSHPASRVLFVCRLAVMAVLALVAWLSATLPLPPVQLAMAAIAIAAALLAPLLVAGIWWGGMNRNGVAAGISGGALVLAACAGFALLGPDLMLLSGDETAIAIPGLANLPSALQAALMALPVVVVLAVGVSSLRRAPRRPAMLEAIRQPYPEPLVRGPEV